MTLSNDWFLAQMNITQYELKLKTQPQFWLIASNEIERHDVFLQDLIFCLAALDVPIKVMTFSELPHQKQQSNVFLLMIETAFSAHLMPAFQAFPQFYAPSFEALKQQGDLKKALWQAIVNWRQQ